MSNLNLTLEDCGRWFYDYVLTDEDDENILFIEPCAKDLPRDLLKKAKRNPEHAKAVLEIYADINKEDANQILESGSISDEDYTKILNLI